MGYILDTYTNAVMQQNLLLFSFEFHRTGMINNLTE